MVDDGDEVDDSEVEALVVAGAVSEVEDLVEVVPVDAGKI